MRTLSILPFLIIIVHFSVFAQVDLDVQLEGQNDFREIVNIIDRYYEGHEEDWRGENGRAPKLKHWKRWEWYMSSRLGHNNEFVSINDSLFKAKKIVQGQYSDDVLRTVNSHWQSVGPSSTTSGIGRADRIAFHPSDPDIFYVGTPASGLWRTTNGGSTWTALTDHMPAIGISGIVVDWENPSTIYMLTGDGDSAYLGGFVDQFGYTRKSMGVWKSTNSGATWYQTGELDPGDYQSFKLVQSPLNSNTLLAATDVGVFKTTNGGATWVKTLNDNVFDLEFRPGNAVVYASSDDKVYYSLFSGDNWTEANFDVNLGSPIRIELAVTPDHNNYVYALIGEVNAAGTYGGTYRSTNGGIDYQLMSSTPNILGSANDGTGNNEFAEYIHSLAVSSADRDMVIAGGVNIWTSSNGAASYSAITNGYHSDIHQLAYNPLDDKLYACTDGGIYLSEDDGATWTPFLDGFNTSQIYHMAGTPLNEDYILIGLQDNGVKLKSDNSSTFTHVRSADGFDVSFNPIDETEFYATINQGARHFTNSGGASTSITPPNANWFGTIRAHISDENTVFYGSDTFQISTDKGNSWSFVLNSATWALETCPSNSNRLYAAGASSYNANSNGTLTRSDDQGATWDSLHLNTGFAPLDSFTKITDIAVNPGNSNSVYVTFGGFFEGQKVYRSTNAGGTWENFSGSLPNMPINAIVVNAAGNQVYIGTDLGVFYRHTSMDDWMPYTNSMPITPVTGLYIDESNDKLYASTFGRGVWKVDLVGNCDNNLTLNGNYEGYKLYQAGNQITTAGLIYGGVGTTTYFKAGNRVLLTPGFRASKNTMFKAYIGGCGEGDIPE
ncbi:MAG: hypothetical protein P1U56_11190 [Saprospiraceae bacterium]|nr:hypothetical protein [Saprospiraceae bacterium]